MQIEEFQTWSEIWLDRQVAERVLFGNTSMKIVLGERVRVYLIPENYLLPMDKADLTAKEMRL